MSRCGGRLGAPRRLSSARPSGASPAWPGDSANVMAVRAFEHPQQPDESWWSSRLGICRWLGGRFFYRPAAIGMNLDDGAVERDRLDLDAHDLRALQAASARTPGPAHRSWTSGSCAYSCLNRPKVMYRGARNVEKRNICEFMSL